MNKNDNTSAHSAQEYDSQVGNTIPNYEQIQNNSVELLKLLKPEPKSWLDTGCGTGTLVKKAYSMFPSTRFALSDPSEQMISQAKEKLKKITEDRFFFLSPVSTQDLPSDAESMDIITAFLCHHYLTVEERVNATQRCYQVLKEGGIYLTVESITPESDTGIEAGLGLWSNFQVSKGKDPIEVNKHISRFGVELKPISIKKHLEILTNCGFRTVELFWYSYLQAGFYAIK